MVKRPPFLPFCALVLGDFFLDRYTSGGVRRISPEAPVPVLEVHSEEERPGGAGNVALNLAALGGKVVVLGRCGFDPEGDALTQQLALKGIETSSLLAESGYRTPVKNRLIAQRQQLLRVDREVISPLPPALEEKIIAKFKDASFGAQVIALSDYGKGFLTQSLIAAAIECAKKTSCPLVVDPKGSDFLKYRGAYLLKPNLAEAYAAAQCASATPLDQVAHILLSQTEADLLLITRSEAGMSLFSRTGVRKDFPVRSREVKDVTGAGDTALAAICFALAHQLEVSLGVQIANVAAGLAIERLGCAQITLDDLEQRLLAEDPLLLRSLPRRDTVAPRKIRQTVLV